MLLLLLGPFLVPVPPLAAASTVEALAGPNSLFLDVPFAGDTLTVHYEEAGDGEPALVLLHGFAASTFSWREMLPVLGEWRRTVAFDRPAFGLTERPLPENWTGDWDAQNPYRATVQTELTAGVLDELGIERAVLVGNSAGGTAAMLAALAYPERVEALVLISPAVYGNRDRSPLVNWLLNTPQARHVGPLVARQIQGWGLDFARSAWHDPSLLTGEIWAGYQKPLQAADWDRALWEQTAAAAPSNLPQQLQALTLPVLVITGDDDRIVATAESVRLAAELPNAELVVIPNCGHVPQEECPQAVLDAIQAFLTGLAQ
jgi:pimeloyl-ACP methyl ester carboxylesterase